MNYQIGFWFLAALMIVLLIASISVLRRGEEWRAVAEANKVRGENLREELSCCEKKHAEQTRGIASERDDLSAELGRLRAETLEKIRAMKEIADDYRVAGDQARDAYAALRSARNVTWVKPARRMPEGEVKRAFAVAADAPLWVALQQELDDWLQGLFDEVSKSPSPTLTEAHRLHMAGGIEELREFQKKLLDLHKAAQTVDADLEGEAPAKGGAA